MEKYLNAGFEPVANRPDEFAAQIRSDLARWGKVVRDANVQVE
jgi:tripartite-type tricarboxylate transporter receptor subunit TctC